MLRRPSGPLLSGRAGLPLRRLADCARALGALQYALGLLLRDAGPIEVTHPAAAPGRSPTPCVFPYVAGDPASVGCWATRRALGRVRRPRGDAATGKVLIVSGSADVGLPTHSRVWDPVTDTLTSQSFTHGPLLQRPCPAPGRPHPVRGGGGNSASDGDQDDAHLRSGQRDVVEGRRHGAHAVVSDAVTLPNGDVYDLRHGTGQAKVEVYNAAANTWTTLPEARTRRSRRTRACTSCRRQSALHRDALVRRPAVADSSPLGDLRPGHNTWAAVDDHVIPNRTEAFSVLLPPPRRPAWQPCTAKRNARAPRPRPCRPRCRASSSRAARATSAARRSSTWPMPRRPGAGSPT